jgi:hypothetical protein
MDFFEAMNLMKSGAKIRLKSWPEEKYIGIKEEERKVFGKMKTKYSVINSDETDLSPVIPFAALVSAEWEVSNVD